MLHAIKACYTGGCTRQQCSSCSSAEGLSRGQGMPDDCRAGHANAKLAVFHTVGCKFIYLDAEWSDPLQPCLLACLPAGLPACLLAGLPACLLAGWLACLPGLLTLSVCMSVCCVCAPVSVGVSVCQTVCICVIIKHMKMQDCQVLNYNLQNNALDAHC